MSYHAKKKHSNNAKNNTIVASAGSIEQNLNLHLKTDITNCWFNLEMIMVNDIKSWNAKACLI